MLRALRQRLGFARRKLIEPAYPKRSDGRLYIHVGCGRKDYPGFVNVDAQAFPHVHVITNDICDLGQFRDNSADMIYMSHVLEHFRIPDVVRVLKEMYRILRPEAFLRLSVPDFDRLIEVYHASGDDISSIEKQLLGGQDSEYNVHYTVFNRGSLEALLSDTGFREVRQWDPWHCAEFHADDSSKKIIRVAGKEVPISLNIDAVK